ncbi:MAG: response regulator transcription factor [Rhizobacter sp.]|nr:response regulator transcription factor [Ferruginibacter sp.]
MDISIAIVEDNHDIRQALEQIINMSGGFDLVCSCENGEDALIKLPIYLPKIVLMDINLGGMTGIEVVKGLKPAHPEMLFMMCTIYEEDEKIFEALKAGASGYIIKKTTPSKLLEAIKELDQGGAPMSSQIARKVVTTFQSKPTVAAEGLVELLTKRELEILEMLASGLVYKEISEKLYISSETVRKHVYNVYNKLHVSNRVEAVNKFYGR